MTGHIQVSKDITGIVKNWLHSSTGEQDTIKLPSPPRLVPWPERHGLGTPIIDNHQTQRRNSLAIKLKKRLLLSKRKRDTYITTNNNTSVCTVEEPEESKNNVLPSLRKRQATWCHTTPQKCVAKRRKRKRNNGLGGNETIDNSCQLLEVNSQSSPYKEVFDGCGFSGHEIKEIKGDSLSQIGSSKKRKRTIKKKK